ncbi:MAG: SDR family NAD(P)-dependent oxidoreductase [bacterium]
MNDSATSPDEPIAIVGIGCRLPGGANDPDGFWRILRDKVDTIGDVPPDRWNVDAYHDPAGKRPGSITSRRGAFVHGMDLFDPAFFGISPREATRIDPQHRLLLEVAWEAMEDAGKLPSELAGTAVGVFVGISWNDYSAIQLAPGNADSIDTHTGTGGANSVAANRISHAFDFRGPSISIDTACSSALVAIHVACQALRNDECSIALAGGVNAMLIPAYFIALSRLNMLSPVGQCRAFDADGKGYVRGEGAGLVALRKLSDAERDGDRIYAVIRGSAVNQDGHTNGITVPSQASQEVVVREACRRAGVRPHDIGYVEAHGTGTPVGDPIEAHALGSVVGRHRADGDTCVIGSVKTNIGHLESAAGIAGLLKATLALAHEQIPPNLHFDTPHPGIPFERFHIRVATALESWPRSATPRYAGVNSFGFGGTNAHVILGEAPACHPERAQRVEGSAPGCHPERAQRVEGSAPNILPMSARSAAAMRARAASLADYLGTLDETTTLDDVCRTAAIRRDHLEHRLAVVATDAASMRQQLDAWLAGEQPPGVRAGKATTAQKIAFAFCGQGPQWWGMARGMLQSSPVFRATVEHVDALMRPLSAASDGHDAPWSLLEELMRDEATSRVHETNILQPAVFAVQMGLADVWRSWGITPSAVVGHSMGEVAAACVAGALSLENAVRLIYHRGRIQHKAAGTGRMLAVGLSRSAGEDAIAGYANRLWIAGVNGPSSITIGGDIAAVTELSEVLAGRGIFHRAVRMEMACHTPHMDPLEREFACALRDIEFGAPVIPFYSTVLGAATSRPLDAEYWWTNMRHPVEFLAATQALVADGASRFIEIGPHPVLASGIAEVLQHVSRQGIVLPSIRRADDDMRVMHHSLATLYSVGERVAWRAVVGAGGNVARLPNYPWQRQRYWNESPRALRERLGTQRNALLGVRQPGANGCWESTLDVARYPFLAHHVVQETLVVPGAALGVLAMIAGEADLPGEGRVVVEELEFAKPLFIPNDGAQTVQLTLRTDGSVEIHSRAEAREDSWTRNATARVRREADFAAPEPQDLTAIRARCTRAVAVADLYQDLAAKGIHLGTAFQGVAQLFGGTHEALARVEAPAEITADLGAYPLHPVLLDSCLQTFLTAMPTGHAGLHLPVEIGRFRLYSRPPSGKFWVHVRMTSWTDRIVEGDAILMDDAGTIFGEATGCVVRVVHESEAVSRVDDDIVYQFQWQLDSGTSRETPAEFLPSPATLAHAALATFDNTSALDAGRYDRYYEAVQPRVEELATTHVAEAMRTLGWQWNVGARIVVADVARQLGIAERHGRLFARLIEMLAEDGCLVPDGGAFLVVRPPSAQSPNERAKAIASDFPWMAPELALLARCGAGLARVLRGEQESVQLVFPNGDLSDVEHLNQDFTVLRAYNGAAAAIVAQLVASVPAGRAIRVLEIGAGTGALTAHVVDILPKECAEYVHTDISPVFGREARRKFAAHPFIRYELLDIEKDPAAQGFAPATFDVVLAGNVLHATTDLTQTLQHARQLLAPGGMALILEATRLPRWVELIFGLTDGWWRFSDGARTGASSPLLTPDRWRSLLADAGFATTADVTDPHRIGQPGHAVIIAQASAQPVAAPHKARAIDAERHWLVLGDRHGTAARIATALREHGIESTLVPRPDCPGEAEIEAIVAAQRDVRSIDEVLYCWSLDETSDPQSDAASIADDQKLGVEGAFHLTRALLSRTEGDAPTRLTFLTAGAQATNNGDAPRVAQAPLWGFARVVMSEHQDMRTRLIDVAADGSFDAELLVDELLTGTEDEVALRGTRRYVRRLAHRRDVRARAPHTAIAGERAFALRVATPGVLDTLEYCAVERGVVRAGEVEVEVEVAGLNFKDVMLAMGMLPDHALDASHGGWTLGREFAGRVVRIGEGVTNVSVGDDVLGLGSSAFGSFCTTFAGAVVRRPPTLTAEQAAAIPLVFVTAHYGLNTLAKMKAGERVLIHSASGGVGLAAIQLAQRVGAEVFATAGTPEKRALVRSLGVHHVMDSRSLAFAEEIMRITGGEGVDIVLNTLPGQAIEKGLSVLRANGRFLEIGRRDIWQNSKIGLRHFTRNLTLIAIDVDRSEVVTQVFREVVDGFADGSLTPLPITTYEPMNIASAFRTMAQSRHTGKLVVAFKGRTVELADARASGSPPVRGDGTYLLTGGLGGFGLVVAEWLVQHGARHLVLLGRSGAATQEAHDAVMRLESAGACVRVVCADVTREREVIRVLDDIARTMPPLRGVMHMAMVLDDSFIAQLELERMRRVMSPKIEGAWNLHRGTEGMELDWFVMFSSAAAVFGNPGQSNYAAANAFFPALAQLRASQGLPALCVDWGRLGGVGYVARHDRVGEFLDRQGYPPVMPDEALAILGELLSGGDTHASVMRVDWPVWRGFFPSTHTISARFVEVASRSHAPGPGGLADKKHQGRASVLAATSSERGARLLALVTEHLARVLGTGSSTVEADARLNDLGLDSLMAVELRNRLEREFGVDIPVMTLLQGPSISGVAELIRVAIGGEAADVLSEAKDLHVEVANPKSPLGGDHGNTSRAPTLDFARAEVPRAEAVVIRPSWFRRNGPALTSAVLRALARVDIQGLDRIPLTGPVVLVANHVNALDALLMFGYMPRRMSSFVKASLQDQPVVGWFVREMLDAIWVARGAGDEVALAQAVAVVRAGGALAINPEGTRSRSGILQTGHSGAAFIASQTGALVVPVAAFGHEHLPRRLRRLSRPTIAVRVGEPMQLPAALTASDLARNTDQIMEALAALMPSQYRGVYGEKNRR